MEILAQYGAAKISRPVQVTRPAISATRETIPVIGIRLVSAISQATRLAISTLLGPVTARVELQTFVQTCVANNSTFSDAGRVFVDQVTARRKATRPLVPAKAGTQGSTLRACCKELGSRFRGNEREIKPEH